MSDRSGLMGVPVVQIGVVDMRVPHRLVAMPMGMRLRHRPGMLVLVMRLMHMAVLVLDRLMPMLMIMAFRQMQPKPDAHQNRRQR